MLGSGNGRQFPIAASSDTLPFDASSDMPRHDSNLHGSVPDKAPTALLLIDVINDLDFPGGKAFLRFALPAAKRIAHLADRARAAKVPVIYVNDNFGRWQSDFREQVRHCLEDNVPGAPLVKLLVPQEQDYFVLKPMHSGFFSTSLDILLAHLHVSTLVLAGFAADICVLYTANDAFMRDFDLVIAQDCVASEAKSAKETALKQMQHHLEATVRMSHQIRFPRKRGRTKA
jgi:nicotinamidase-related amidase